MRRVLIALLIVASPSFLKGDVLVIRNVRVFDGFTFREGLNVVIRDGIVDSVVPRVDVPQHATVVDGAGQTLLPGLIDAHVHVLHAEALQQALVLGVTTLLDMGIDPQKLSAIRAAPAGASADLFSAGPIATAPGGHGTEYGYPTPTVSTPAEAQSFVADAVDVGADYIKIVYDDGSTYHPIPTLDLQTVRSLITAAHGRRKLAVVHTGTQKEAEEAVGAGADGLAHLFLDSQPRRAFLRSAAQRGAFVVPTLSVLSRLCREPESPALRDPRLDPYVTESQRVALLRQPPFALRIQPECSAPGRTVRALRDAGVTILAGSDASSAIGLGLHQELHLLVQSGLTPLQALRSATSAPARAFGLADRGVIRKGAVADLLLVEGNPAKDIGAVRHITRIWKNGKPVDRDLYRQKIAQVKIEERRQRETAPPASAESGVLLDFDQSERPRFGGGWAPNTDSILGGKSTAKVMVGEEGAPSGKYLVVEGEVRRGYPFPWAGVSFVLGPRFGAPVNLSAKQSLVVVARADGGEYRVQLSAKSYGFLPVTQRFTVQPDWKAYHFPLRSFDGMDGHDVTTLGFVAGPDAGSFRLHIREIRFE